MAPNNTVKGRGYIPDEDNKNDKMIDMQALHHVVDLSQLHSFDIFNDKFRIDPAKEETMSYQAHDVYDQDSVSSCTSNAVASAYRYMLQRHGLPDFQPSRLFLYYLAQTPEARVTAAGFLADERGAYYQIALHRMWPLSSTIANSRIEQNKTSSLGMFSLLVGNRYLRFHKEMILRRR